MIQTIVIPLLIGSVGGLIAALCGVGGGVVMVPAFVMLLGIDQKHAIATSLAVIAPTALMTIFKHTGNDLVNWKLFVPTAIGACLFAFFAADWVKSMSNETLTRIFGGVMVAIGVYMLLRKV
ncbi:MAG: sulfite exporter TauE/SafE family protein [Verrucomicrobiae bacterium]|nr:sulfite exporter TauE/SafE family protein [Verrucomicrobiae bacterium]MCB1086193.1 sulfite exporter TauE/SafE family protein [Verrucomicrobiae bacterium]MCB1092822.1 sulfite exporter TauE/SafE family protein [Verrucomicrobiae bacterium]